MRCRLLALSLALAGAALALPAAAQWKWRAANGQIQYSDLPPPPGVSEKDILLRPTAASLRAATNAAAAPAASAVPAPASAPVDAELEAKRKKAEQEAAAKAKEEQQRVAAAKADNCNRAREQLRTLESGMRMARINDKGEREVLDDKMRAEEMKRARDLANADCGKQ